MMISYIVTVYNLEKYISQCLDSLVRNADDDNVEILVVDDGSNDETGAICDIYKSKYSFINVIHQLNGGLAHARNVGTRESHGDWLCFIDGDDYVFDGLTKTLSKYLSNDVDIVFFDNVTGSNDASYHSVPAGKIHLFEQLALYPSPLLKKDEQCSSVHITTQWAKFYRKNFLEENDINSIESVVLAQDILFNTTVYSYKPRMGYINKKFYYHRILLDSSCHKYRPNYTDISINFIDNMYAIIDKYYNNRPEVLCMATCSIINLTANNCRLNFFNRQNQLQEVEKERAFLDYISIETIRNAIDFCNEEFLTASHKHFLHLIRIKDINGIEKYFVKEYRNLFLKSVLMQDKSGMLIKAAVTVKKLLRNLLH